MYLIYFFLAIGFATDPTTSDFLEVIDQHVGKKALCESFPNMETHEFERENCSLFGCDRWDYFIQSHCADGSAVLEHIKSNGQVYSRQVFKEDAWSAQNGNLIRIYKQNVESYGNRFEITELTSTNDALSVHYQIFRDSQMIAHGEWQLKATDIFGQMFFRSETATFPMKEVKVDRFKN